MELFLNDLAKNMLLWVVIAVVLMSVFNGLETKNTRTETIPYSEFIHSVKTGQVSKVVIVGRAIEGWTSSNDKFKTLSPETDNRSLIGELLEANVEIKAETQENSLLMQMFISWFPFLLLIGVWVFFMRQMQGGGGKGGPMSFGKSKAKLMEEDKNKTTFDDVAGVEEAKEEVSELVEFLSEPEKFQKLGAKIPRGILLVGSPGTGKTLLAKAIAGEAKVPFFNISGSDFVEMFVGVGASRVRDMFENAKKHAPCIIFIDEIDAVGRQRGAGVGGGHDEREQTLNQLLVEMDGFEGTEGVIVIAATNRPDVLDAALLRPGRFDRQVVVPLPDIRGREQILKVHVRKMPVDKDVDVSLIARGTPGFSGADLANLANEAALFAAKSNKTSVTMNDFERAKDKIIMGAERKTMVMNEDEKKMTAYHESGHAIVGRLVEDHDPVYKVSIIPRGRALGVTMFLPEEDRYSYSKLRLNSQIASLFGGRIAEELIYGKDQVTTGASNDIERATEIARNMVTKWGLSEKLGPLAYSEEEGEVFLGRSVTQHKSVSNDTAAIIDLEIRKTIDENYENAYKILKDNVDILHKMTETLMTYETIDSSQIDQLMKREEPGAPRDWTDDDKKPKGDSKKDTPKKAKKKEKDDVKKDNDGSVGDAANSH